MVLGEFTIRHSVVTQFSYKNKSKLSYFSKQNHVRMKRCDLKFIVFIMYLYSLFSWLLLLLLRLSTLYLSRVSFSLSLLVWYFISSSECALYGKSAPLLLWGVYEQTNRNRKTDSCRCRDRGLVYSQLFLTLHEHCSLRCKFSVQSKEIYNRCCYYSKLLFVFKLPFNICMAKHQVENEVKKTTGGNYHITQHK